MQEAVAPRAAHEAERRDQAAELEILHDQRPRSHGDTEAADRGLGMLVLTIVVALLVLPYWNLLALPLVVP